MFDDIREDVETWLPAIAVHLPGSGITPFNVWELTFAWWRIYRQRAVEIVTDIRKQNEQAARRK